MKYLLLSLIRIYQKTSQARKIILGSILPLSSSCRFSPTCSEYTYQMVKKYGVGKGSFLGIKKIISCNPFSSFGLKPL